MDNTRDSRTRGRILRHLLRKFSRRHLALWFHLPLGNELPTVHPRLDVSMDADHPEEVLAFIRRQGIAGTNDPKEIRHMRQRGHLFIGAREGRHLIGFVKLGWDRVYVLDYGIDVHLPPGCFFVLESYILPTKRRHGVGRYLIAATSNYMRSRGFTQRIAHVRLDNTPMICAGLGSGYRPLGCVEYTSFLGLRRFSPHPQRLLSHFSATQALEEMTSAS